jgi:hypothetical protein
MAGLTAVVIEIGLRAGEPGSLSEAVRILDLDRLRIVGHAQAILPRHGRGHFAAEESGWMQFAQGDGIAGLGMDRGYGLRPRQKCADRGRALYEDRGSRTDRHARRARLPRLLRRTAPNLLRISWQRAS